jgi:hypothetical protein
MMAAVYGIRAPQSTTPEAATFTQVQLDFMYALELGKMPPVDLFPILNWLPERLAPWKTQVMDIKRRQEELFGGLLNKAKDRVMGERSADCFMEEAYEHQEEWGLSDHMLMY